MADVLCMYYSRTGNTKQTMQEIAEALDAELVELQDGVDRSGWSGWLRSGLDAVRRTTRRTKSLKTEKKLANYRLVIIGTPVWAGRCSSVIRALLKRRGLEMKRVAYLLTRDSDKRYEEIYEQMDLHVPCGHCAAVSLRSGSVGYAFWQEEFLRQVREYLGRQQ